MANVLFYLITWLLVSVAGTKAAGTTMLTTTTTTKPGCSKTCGNLTIPYPFGFEPGCSLTPSYSLTCLTSFNPPKAFLVNDAQTQSHFQNTITTHEIIDISETQFRVRNAVVFKCDQLNTSAKSEEHGMVLPPDSPFVFSATANSIFAVGCGFSTLVSGPSKNMIGMSNSFCDKEKVIAGKCLATNGCSELVIRRALKEFYYQVSRPGPETFSFDRCGYSFIGDAKAFKFQGLSDFLDQTVFVSRTVQNVHLVVDWVIGNQTCKDAQANACQNNSKCVDAVSGIGGYNCVCLPDHGGNPYLPPGCYSKNLLAFNGSS